MQSRLYNVSVVFLCECNFSSLIPPHLMQLQQSLVSQPQFTSALQYPMTVTCNGIVILIVIWINQGIEKNAFVDNVPKLPVLTTFGKQSNFLQCAYNCLQNVGKYLVFVHAQNK